MNLRKYAAPWVACLLLIRFYGACSELGKTTTKQHILGRIFAGNTDCQKQHLHQHCVCLDWLSSGRRDVHFTLPMVLLARIKKLTSKGPITGGYGLLASNLVLWNVLAVD